MPASKKKSSASLAQDASAGAASGSGTSKSGSASTSKQAATGATASSSASSSASKKRRASPASSRAAASSPARHAPSASPATRTVPLAHGGPSSTSATGASAGTGPATAAAAPQSKAAKQAIANAKAVGFTLPPGAIPTDFESDEETSDGDFLDDDDVVDGKDYGDDACAESATCQWESCGKVFYHLEPLIEHVQDEHLASNPNRFFVCLWTGCTRGAKIQMSRFSMMSHLRSHTGEKPYACPRPECDKGFARSDALSKHLKQYHHIQPIPNRRTAASAMKKAKARAGADDDEDGEGGTGLGGDDDSIAQITTGPGSLSIRQGGADGEDMTRVKSEYDSLTSGLGMGSLTNPVGAVETAAAAAEHPVFSWGKGAPPQNELLPGFQYVEGKGPPARESLLAQDYADLEDEVVLARARDMRKRARESVMARRKVLSQPGQSVAEISQTAEADFELKLLLSDEGSSEEEDEGLAAADDEEKSRSAKRARTSATPTTPAALLPPRNPMLDASALISNSRTSNGSSTATSSTQANGKSSKGNASTAASSSSTTKTTLTISDEALARLHEKYIIAKAKLRYLESERQVLEQDYELARQEAIKEKADTTAVLEQVLVADLSQDVEAIFSPQNSPTLSPLAL